MIKFLEIHFKNGGIIMMSYMAIGAIGAVAGAIIGAVVGIVRGMSKKKDDDEK